MHFKQFVFPANYYNKNPIEAITSVVGTNAEIISIKRHKLILPNNRVLIDVKYKSIDFDTFTIYLCDNPKLVSIGSNYMISINNTDIRTGEKVNIPIKIFKPVLSSLNNDLTKCFIKINTLIADNSQNNERNNILHYYGIQIKDPHDILHDYCSMFKFNKDTNLLKEISSEIELKKYVTTFDQLTKFIDLVNTKDFPLKLGTVNKEEQIKAYEDLTTVASLDPNSRKDIEYFKLKLETRSFLELSEDSNNNEIIYKTILKNKNIAYHIDFKNVTPKTLKDFISKLKTGVIILMKKRYYTSLIYIRDETKIINVNEFYTILEKDLSNIIQLNKYLIENKLGNIDVKESEQATGQI
jgi:hypothetical protein